MHSIRWQQLECSKMKQ